MPTAPAPMKSGTPKLSEVARVVHAPAGITTTGWPAVAGKCADFGIVFRSWQVALGRLILAKRADGQYAATIGGTGASIPRQVGKTFLIAAIMFALCLLRPGFTVLWTAHRLKTAEETFGKLQVFARRRRIAPFVKQIFTGSGEQQIVFHNGSRILFGARERGFGRGFDEVDALVFDEAQILTDSALDDMIPATNQSRQPEGVLMLFLGTPPRPKDPGEVFTRMRNDAMAGDEDTAWVEFGADPAYRPTPLPAPLTDADWGQVTVANPSFPEDTSRTAILRMRKKLGDDSFLREGMGIWLDTALTGDLDYRKWLDLKDPEAERGKPVVFGVDIGEDRLASIAVAWKRLDGAVQVMMADSHIASSLADDRIRHLTNEWGGFVVLGGPAEGLAPSLAGVRKVLASGSDFATASGYLTDLIRDGEIHHGNQPELNAAVETARLRNVGVSGAKAVVLKNAPLIGPLAAVARALHGIRTGPSSIYEERDMVILG